MTAPVSPCLTHGATLLPASIVLHRSPLPTQTMSKGETHRKSLHQKYEDEQLVRAKSGRV